MADPATILPFHKLLRLLEAQGFWFGMDTRHRLAAYWTFILEKKETGRAVLKHQLSALLCKSADEQQRFSEVFEAYFPDFENPEWRTEEDFSAPVLQKEDRPENLPDERGLAPALPGKKLKPRKISFRQGPILPPLAFPENPLRVWNLSRMSRALIPLQEKIWMDTAEWDIPATIRQTIRSGGFPNLKFRKKKRAPRYLALIEQWHPRDHLAGFAADLMIEMNRRDLETDFYFYANNPARCWKNLNDPRSHVYLEYLKSEWEGARLLLIGRASGFVDVLTGQPTPLALDLAENWGQVALLTTNSVLEWGESEMTLLSLFPLAPLSVEGLDSLMQQWNTGQFLHAHHWLEKYSEPVPPALSPDRLRSKDDILLNLFRYLEKDAFRWMCSTSVYPEVYYKMTAHLHDEAIPRQSLLSEWEQNEIWHKALRLISKLEWYRLGYVPEGMREKLRSLLAAPDLATVETEIRRILDWSHNAVDVNSYAYRERKEMYDWLAANSFRILWIDDHPENNTFFQNRLIKSYGLVIKNALSAGEAQEMLAEHFDLVISDIGRKKEKDGGLGTMNAVRSRNAEVPVVFFTNTRGMNLRRRLLEEGALEVVNDYEMLENIVKERLEWKFGKAEEVISNNEAEFENVETGSFENIAQQSQLYDTPSLENEPENLPEFSSMEALRHFLKEVISSGNLDAGFEQFNRILDEKAYLKNDLSLLEGQFLKLQSDRSKEAISFETFDMETNRIRFIFLEYTDRLEASDLKPGIIPPDTRNFYA